MNIPMSIRPAMIEDSEVLSRLVLAASESVRDSDFTPQGWKLLEATNTPEAFQERFQSDAYLALIYEADGNAVGYLAVIGFEKIDHMFVLPRYQRRGISSRLWSHAKRICEQAGHGSYYWVRSSTMAEHAYLSFGFRPAGNRQLKNGISSRLMEMGVKSDK